MNILGLKLRLLLLASFVLGSGGALGDLYLNELKVNPPGTNDAPNEFIEIKGAPNALLTNLCLLAINGDSGRDPGKVTWKCDLNGGSLGTNGLLLIVAPNHPYAVASGTTVLTDTQLGQPGGTLDNGSISFLLVGTAADIRVGNDLDKGDNGILEGLPSDAAILDAVGWSDGGHGDVVYGGAVLHLAGATPDAATRFPWDPTPASAAAWFCGDLVGPEGASLAYDSTRVSPNYPSGTLLTPGALNATAPMAAGLVPISGVIGDPSNPVISFVVTNSESTGSFAVTATSDNPAVVPDSHLVVSAATGGLRTLSIDPVGVGYAKITLWLTDGELVGKAVVPYAASASGREGGIWYLGASDGSTAIPVDVEHMLIGDDENQTIRLFDRYRSGLPLASFDMGPFLALPDAPSGLQREVDVEASTRIGNRLFWMGSLGHAASGETRTNRTRVFATELTPAGSASSLAYLGRYDYLKLDLINWDAWNLHGKGTNYYGLEASDAVGVPPKAPDGSGFAVEGLAMMPGSTNGAYVGFRAPIVPPTDRTFALIVPVLNFATLAATGGPPGSAVFGPPVELDLYGRGIRSLEGSSEGYLIIGGSAGPGTGVYPDDFRLYTWTGDMSDQPQQRTADLSGLNPEGIVEVPPQPWTPLSQVQVVSDQGAMVFYGDDVPAKLLPIPNFKKTRGDVLALGAITPPVPIILSVRWDSGTITIRWRALKGLKYRIQASSDPGAGTWTDLDGEVLATGPHASATISAPEPAQYYRLLVLQ